MLKASELQAAIEAILFAAGEPIHINKISEVLQIDIEQVLEVMLSLQTELEKRNSGLCIMNLSNKYQLCTRKEYAQQVREVLDIKRNAPLSQAAFEVLAVVAYNQPVTKSFVEQVRGVDCSGVMSTLSQKGLIEEKGRMDLPGKPLIYGTTENFLRCFCLTSLDDLPPLPESNDGVKTDNIENDFNNELEEQQKN